MGEKDCGRALRRLLFYDGCLLAAGLCALAYLLFLQETGFSYPCMFSRFSHLYCPGCGVTRALTLLLRLDIAGSFLAHPFVLLAIPLFCWYQYRFVRALRHPSELIPTFPVIVYAAGLMVFAVVRDILLVYCRLDSLGDLIRFWS